MKCEHVFNASDRPHTRGKRPCPWRAAWRPARRATSPAPPPGAPRALRGPRAAPADTQTNSVTYLAFTRVKLLPLFQ